MSKADILAVAESMMSKNTECLKDVQKYGECVDLMDLDTSNTSTEDEDL